MTVRFGSTILAGRVIDYEGIDPQAGLDQSAHEFGSRLLYKLHVEQVFGGAELAAGDEPVLHFAGMPSHVSVSEGGYLWRITDDPPLSSGSRYLLVVSRAQDGVLYIGAPERFRIADDGTVHYVDTAIPLIDGLTLIEGKTLADAAQVLTDYLSNLTPTPVRNATPAPATATPTDTPGAATDTPGETP